MQQFSKNATFTLRAVSLYDKGYGHMGDRPVMKVGEPSQKGTKYDDGVEVLALEKHASGGWIVEFPNGELGLCDKNKILANAQEENSYVMKKKAAQAGGVQLTKAAPKALTPIEKVKALKEEREALTARLEEIAAEYPKALEALQMARLEEEELLKELSA